MVMASNPQNKTELSIVFYGKICYTVHNYQFVITINFWGGCTDEQNFIDR